MPDEGSDDVILPEDELERKELTESASTSLAEILRSFSRPRDFSLLLLTGLFVVGIVFLLSFARPFLLPVVLAVVLSFILKPVVRQLTRMHLPPALGAGLVLAVLLGLLGWGGVRVYEPAMEWIGRAPDNLRTVETKVRQLLRPAEQLNRAAQQVEQMATGADATGRGQFTIRQGSLSDSILDFTWSFLAGTVEMVVLLYFLLAVGDLFRGKLVKVLPTEQVQNEALTIAEEVESTITTYLSTVTVINLCLGVLVGGSMYLLGVPNPVLWGTVAAFLNFIPYLGPATGVLILLALGLVTFDTVGQAVLPPFFYISLHSVEANLITPMVLGRRLILNPVVIFISIMFWSWLWGVPGALLAVPMLMMLKVLCDHIQPLKSLGEFLGR